MNLDDIQDKGATGISPTSQIGAVFKSSGHLASKSSVDDLYSAAYEKLAFGQNRALDNCDLLRVRSSRRNYILLDDYLKTMRKIYYEATYKEVDWYGFHGQFNLFGIPKTKRAADAHAIPRLCFLTQSK